MKNTMLMIKYILMIKIQVIKLLFIENEVLNRADEFTKNNGLKYIQNEVLKASMYISKTPLLGQDFSNPSIHDFSSVTFTIPTMDEI